MPIFERLIPALVTGLALIALAACEAETSATPRGTALLDRDPATLRSALIELPGGPVRIGVPQGACIAPRAGRIDLRSAVIVAGDCSAIVARPVRPGIGAGALYTAAISDAPMPGEGSAAQRVAAIEELLHDGLGDMLLGEEGAEGDLVETRLDGDTVYALVDTGRDTAFRSASPLMWRAIFEERGHMIVLSARTLRNDLFGAQTLLEQAKAFRESTRTLNRRG